ncbi:MAG: hypothetical protein MAG795_00876 [Candidatus Woesearchaeota archaeon]|nr:hypothetical protein [Candidatus Woesearchaeota archaeon]
MRKKGILSALIIFFILFLTLDSGAQTTKGCCANPDTTILGDKGGSYCSDSEATKLSQAQCCPVDGNYNVSQSHPENQTDCQLNYWQGEFCIGLTPCDDGCCYDVTTTFKCGENTQFECLNQSALNKWEPGFENHEMYKYNPCYKNKQDSVTGLYIKKIDECPDMDPCTEELGISKQECLAKTHGTEGCFWCPDQAGQGNNTCFTKCNPGCEAYSSDLDADNICDADSKKYGYCAAEEVICDNPVAEKCRCGSVLAQEDEFCCAIRSKTFSTEKGCDFDCHPYCNINEQISETKADFPGYDRCFCGDPLVNFDDDDWYCCINATGGVEPKKSKCFQTGSVQGQVTDMDTDNVIPGAPITISQHDTYTDVNGKYLIEDILVGEHSLVANPTNYKSETKTIELTTDGQVLTKDFQLEPNIPRCENPLVEPEDIDPQLDYDNQLGTITVSWTNVCPETIMGFYVFRNGQLEAFTGDTFFEDTTFPWGDYVTYKIGAMYDYGKVYNYTTSEFYTGDPICVGKAGQEMCINNSRYECTDRSLLNIKWNCGSDHQCMGPGESGKTICKADESCPDLGDPFGAFHTSEQCLGTKFPSEDTYQNPCYYDYSLTPLDSCYDCSNETSCYDYQSQAACVTDNCLAGGAEGCKYLDANQELGKGVCYSQNQWTDCGLCNDPFMNCSAEQCATLGQCYLLGTECLDCHQDNVRCGDYEDKFSCNGGQNFTIEPGSCEPLRQRTYSNDTCGIGYCVWTGSGCSREPETPTVIVPPPTTNIHFQPPGIMKKGTNITFSVDPLPGSDTFYCFDKIGKCCPDIKARHKALELPADHSFDQDWYYIRYYSKDEYGNLETPKVEQFYYDSLAPQIQINYSISNASGLESDLYIDINLDEKAKCDQNLIPTAINSSGHNPNNYADVFHVLYQDLYDGTYVYNVTCTDLVGNTANIHQEISVDRINFIFDEEPLGEIVSPESVTLRVKTPEESGCKYFRTSENGGRISHQTTDMVMKSHESSPFEHYIYEKIVHEIASDPYFYRVECGEDIATVYFSIDAIGPTTTLNYIGQWDPNNGWYNPGAEFELVCEDMPSEFGFGCNQTTYCQGEGCTPDSLAATFTVQNSQTYCYLSEDNGGNIGNTECTQINIDSTPPTKPDVNDTNKETPHTPEFTFRQDRLQAWFSSFDNESGIDHYVYQVVSEDGEVIVFASETDEHEDWFTINDYVSNWKTDQDDDPIKLKNMTTYYIKVYAVDKTGLKSQNATSDGITVDTTKVKPLCTDGKQNGDETGLDCGGSCPACSTEPKVCGDDEVNRPKEDCDGSDLEGKECSDFDDYDEGFVLSCKSDCTFDFSECQGPGEECGDNVVNQMTEDCDGSDLKGLNCQDFGYNGGSLSCKDCEFDTSSCTSPRNDFCGDGDKNRDIEECDSPDLVSKECSDFDDYILGDLDCTSDCLFDTTDCSGIDDKKCGDDDVNQITEVCDGDDLNNRDCQYFGYAVGTLSCKTSCEYDFTGCVTKEVNCNDNDDCESGFCHPASNICMNPSCSDGFENQHETDVDCGGACSTKCKAGKGCENDYDCETRYCNQRTGKCEGTTTDHCSNNQLDQGKESDIDCGIDCEPCKTGSICETSEDCDSGVCEDNECKQATCEDGVKNKAESDIDCGGLCSGCAENKKCFTDSDCLSGNCDSKICIKSDDADEDRLPDWWEEEYCDGGDCDPYADPDGDGLDNYDEFVNNANPFEKDTDGDGHKDGKEVNKNYLPDDPDSHPKSKVLLFIILFILILLVAGVIYLASQDKFNIKKPKKPTKKSTKSKPKRPGARPTPPRPRTTRKPVSPTKLEKIAKPNISRKKSKYKRRKQIFDEFSGKQKKTIDNVVQKPEDKKDKKSVKQSGFKRQGDVWERLNTMNTVEMKRMNLSHKQVHNQLAQMFGKKLSKHSLDILSKLVDSEYVTKDNLVDEFSNLSKEGKFSLAVLKKVLASMKKSKHITQAELKKHLDKLHSKKIITKKDKEDILKYLK